MCWIRCGRRRKDTKIMVPERLSFSPNPCSARIVQSLATTDTGSLHLRCASNSTHVVLGERPKNDGPPDRSPRINQDAYSPNGFIPPFPAFRRRILAAALRSWNVVVKSRLAIVLCRFTLLLRSGMVAALEAKVTAYSGRIRPTTTACAHRTDQPSLT